MKTYFKKIVGAALVAVVGIGSVGCMAAKCDPTLNPWCVKEGPMSSEERNIVAAQSINAVSGLNNKLFWLQHNAQSGGNYVIYVDEDTRLSTSGTGVTRYLGDLGHIIARRNNITITLDGVGDNRTISGTFSIPEGITLILNNNITIHGRIGVSGTLVMNDGASIVGNTSNIGIDGGGVSVHGTFIMNGGAISGNTISLDTALLRSTTEQQLQRFQQMQAHGEQLRQQQHQRRQLYTAATHAAVTLSTDNQRAQRFSADAAGRAMQQQNRQYQQITEMTENAYGTAEEQIINNMNERLAKGVRGGGVYVWPQGTFIKTGGIISGNMAIGTDASGSQIFFEGSGDNPSVAINSPVESNMNLTFRDGRLLEFATDSVDTQPLDRQSTLAVYVYGHSDQNVNRFLADAITRALVQTEHYRETPRYEEFLTTLENERQRQQLAESRIVELARNFEIQEVGILSMSSILGTYVISAKIVNTETNATMAETELDKSLASLADIRAASDEFVSRMIGAVERDEQQISVVIFEPIPTPAEVVATIRPIQDAPTISNNSRNTPLAPETSLSVQRPAVAERVVIEFVATPNPANRAGGAPVVFSIDGADVTSWVLNVRGSRGQRFNRITASTPTINWNFTDRNGRVVNPGTYEIIGNVTLSNGTRENVSMMIEVR